MEEYFLDEPEFDVTSGDIFVLTLKNNYLSRNEIEEESIKKNKAIGDNWENLSEMERKVLQFIADRGQANVVELSDYIDRSDSTTRRLLKNLENKDLISWYGTNIYDPKKVYKIK